MQIPAWWPSEKPYIMGDSKVETKQLPENSFDAIITDPPYELGFMGKKWDSTGIAYDKEFWEGQLRVLKPGGHLLAFGGTRTYHRMTCAIEDAGFEIRDMIEWIYGSGFPKSLNIEKAINKMDGVKFKEKPANGVGFMNENDDGYRTTKNQLEQIGDSTERANEWEGWGTALKPAHEPICVARKPFQGTVAENVLKWGNGGLNIDGCRIPLNGEPNPAGSAKRVFKSNKFTDSKIYGDNTTTSDKGRFPANLILECICEETKEGQEIGNGHFNSKVKMVDHTLYEGGFKDFEQQDGVLKEKSLIHTNPDCPCYLLDAQSGQLSSGSISTVNSTKQNNVYGKFNKANVNDFHANKGGASRFFYCAKASKSERDEGVAGVAGVGALRDGGRPSEPRRNTHPTVKPVATMGYLIKLVTKPGYIVLDPFLGSGSTMFACRMTERQCLGYEIGEEYEKILHGHSMSNRPALETYRGKD